MEDFFFERYQKMIYSRWLRQFVKWQVYDILPECFAKNVISISSIVVLYVCIHACSRPVTKSFLKKCLYIRDIMCFYWFLLGRLKNVINPEKDRSNWRTHDSRHHPRCPKQRWMEKTCSRLLRSRMMMMMMIGVLWNLFPKPPQST